MAQRDGSTRLDPGDWFLRFRIERVLGEGGLGVVYAASDVGRICALKLVKASWIHDEEQRRRLSREGALLEHIHHPNIVDVHETGITADGIAWMRMELLRGAPLRDVLRRRGRLPPAVASWRTRVGWAPRRRRTWYTCRSVAVEPHHAEREFRPVTPRRHLPPPLPRRALYQGGGHGRRVRGDRREDQ